MHDLVSNIRKGNISSFKELFEDYYPVLCVFASKFIKDDEQCKDIVQEVLLAYWEKRADFDNIYKVRGFLYMSVKNRCLNHIKHEKISNDFIEETLLESDEYFEEQMIEQETYLYVRKAVDSLPNQMRLIINHAMEGKRNIQIAEEMGISEGTVHSLKKTAYRKLREILGDKYYILFFLWMV